MSAYRASQDTRRASASRPADTGRAAADRPALISMRSAMTLYARPGAEGAKVTVNSRYENYMGGQWVPPAQDRKSTRLNSSHVAISYAVFCLKKKRII